jgi:hypothetical protein
MRTSTAYVVAVLVGVLACVPAVAQMTRAGGMDPITPTVTSPLEGSFVGPRVDVEGWARPGQLVVITTACYHALTGEYVGLVPGIRHYPNADGSFHFRVATPRISIGERAPLRYELRVYTMAGGRESAPEIVTLYQAR